MRRIAGKVCGIAAAGCLLVSAAFADLAMKAMSARRKVDPQTDS